MARVQMVLGSMGPMWLYSRKGLVLDLEIVVDFLLQLHLGLILEVLVEALNCGLVHLGSVGGLGSFSLRNIWNSTSLRLCYLHPKALAYPASPGSPQAFPLWPAPHACTRQPRDPKRQTLPRLLCTSDQSFELLRLSIRRLPVFAIPAPVFRS